MGGRYARWTPLDEHGNVAHTHGRWRGEPATRSPAVLETYCSRRIPDFPGADDSGTRFDVMFRLVVDLSSPSTDLRTPCFTVTVK
jgi:hypothetical protein